MMGKSSHIRMRDHGDCTRGNLVVFSSEKSKELLSSEYANVLHIALPVNGKRPLPDFEPLSNVLEEQFLLPVEQVERMWRFDMKACIEHARKSTDAKWKAILDVIHNGIIPDGKPYPCKQAQHHDKTRDIYRIIMADRHPAGEYLDRVSTLLGCGQIILCLPQTHYSDTVVYDSGLTIILKGAKPVTKKELEQCYWIGYKVSTFLASFRGLAEKLGAEMRREITHSLARALSHEVANAGNIIRSIVEKTELPENTKRDIQARTYIAASAARAVVAEASSKRQNVEAQTKEITNQYREFIDFDLAVDCDSNLLSRIELPMTYELLLNELIRNAYKHSSEGKNSIKSATLRIYKDEINNKLIVVLCNTPENARKLECLEDGINNPDSQRLTRLRELAALLKASIILKRTSPDICLEIHIPLPTKTKS
jgi:two-component sensor histidine kinase